MARRLLLATLCPGLAVLTLAPSPAAAPPASPLSAEIARLIRQLGDDDFDVREDATERLKRIGEPAIEALDRAATSDDAEVRRRARRVVAAIEAKEPLCLKRHKGAVTIVRFSPDGRRLLTAGDDGTLRLWDARSGKALHTIRARRHGPLCATFSADGKFVLFGGQDRSVCLWDAATGGRVRTLSGHRKPVTSLASGPAGKALSVDAAGVAYLWDLATGEKGRAFAGKEKASRVAVSPATGLFATCDARGAGRPVSFCLWAAGKGGLIAKGEGGQVPNPTQILCFSADGKRLLTADGGIDALCVWDATTGKEVAQLGRMTFWCAALSADGGRAACAGASDGAITVLDVATGKPVRRYVGHKYANAAAAKAARRLSSLATDGTEDPLTAGTIDLDFSPDGRRLASAGTDGTACIWLVPR